jgi:radical SAM-linked protein
VSARAQRLRVTFSRGAGARFISHLDLMRFWERAVRRARLPVSYSEGFTPHAQIALAAPLSVGQTSDGEVMDLYLAEPLAPGEVCARLKAQLPPFLEIASVEQVEVGLPSLQSLVRAAEYRVSLQPGVEPALIEKKVDEFLAAASVPWEHRRDKDVKRYDLRPLVETLAVLEEGTGLVLKMRLRATEGGTARADQVAAALGVGDAVAGIHRVRLLLAQPDRAG